MSETIEQPKMAWYRQPLVWMIIGIPASSVIMGVLLILLSIYTYDGLVADDYYRRGLQINRDLGRDREALTQQLRAEISVDPATRAVNAFITRGKGMQAKLPGRLTLRLIHPTRAGADRTVILDRRETGEYYGRAAPLESGRWHILLETDAWRLTGRMPVPGTGLVDLSPGV